MSQVFTRALVTGGAGFIGSHLAKRLLNEGLEVVVLDDLSTGTKKNLPSACRFIEGSISNPEVVAQSLKGVDIVFHNAARVSVRASVKQFVEDAQTNVLGTLVLLQALIAAQVKKLVLASSMAVYADSPQPQAIPEDYPQRPLAPYGTGKLAAEHYALQVCAAHGIDVVPLRYFNTFGPGQAFTPYVGVVTIFATKLLRGERPTIYGDGLQMRDFVSVHDIVQGNICAMRSTTTGQAINLGSGVGITVKEIADLLVAKIAPYLSPDYAPPQAGETRNSIADIQRAKSLLNFSPTHSFRTDLDEIVDAVRGELE